MIFAPVAQTSPVVVNSEEQKVRIWLRSVKERLQPS